jgi:hypothetical protein
VIQGVQWRVAIAREVAPFLGAHWLAAGPGTVQQHGHSCGHDRGPGCDEGDLPAGHVADGDGLHRAAVLHGAAQALLDQTGVSWATFAAGIRQESLDQAGAALGDEQFQRAYARGTALSFDQTIGLALDEVPIPPSS